MPARRRFCCSASLGDDIRDQIAYLDLPWRGCELADGFVAIGSVVRFMLLTAEDLERSFLALDGAPLMAAGRYRR
ncbi:hypothetical protein MA6G0728R_5299 [Mycobacteroides abscessus 6G-0728-R]|nr:hypothetical protein MA6G0125S_5463 [Mycobacteroides abscessus 6G-0125-S]EIU64152.1 hypothetical protein MA6G0728S_5269 [Mycobacteroides abscessus 6G-0728-S]EIU74818.1 hypothetical protein MA6G1108_5466 [Mycobacteroides abscessus 6G-1108]EIV03019.1 hypothetical protein MA6G0728R_5299 [Mycobacteroides abscessus 6G-0728-R]